MTALGWGSVVCAMGASIVVFAVATAAPAGCEPIGYAVGGAPPATLVAELHGAAAEVERQTGIPFVPVAERDATLRIEWTSAPLPPATGGATEMESAPVDGKTRRIGTAVGRWRSPGGVARLSSGSVVLDGTWRWGPGSTHGDGLGSALIHELGHVIGLPHSDETDSYMYPSVSPTTRRWTEHDRTLLAEVSRLTGCSPAP